MGGQIKGRIGHGLNRKQQRMAYLFITPPMLLFFIFSVIPTIMALVMGFTNYNIIQQPSYVGIKNFIRIFSDPFFYTCLKNTLFYVLIYMPAGTLMALGSALMLNRKRFGVTAFRLCFFVPVLSSSIASATIWLWLFNPQHGLINNMLSWFHINGPAWLSNSSTAMIAIIIMSVWAGFGFNMMIYLAGLQGIPQYLYEAAELDGASRIQTFRYVTWPALSSTTFLVTTMLCIGAFQMFDQAYLLTQGGPGNSTMTLVYYIYNTGFGSLQMGYASALSIILFIVIFVFSLANMRANQNIVEY